MPETTIRREKLVRDKIGARILKSDEQSKIRIAQRGYERMCQLLLKGYEEWREVCEAVREKDRTKLVEELGDWWDVMEAIAKEKGIPLAEISRSRLRKAAENGRFDEGYLLRID